jgi:hypothetical protein
MHSKTTYDIYNYNFACVLHRCETWSLILGEEHGLRVFENRVLTRISGDKRNDVIRIVENTT